MADRPTSDFDFDFGAGQGGADDGGSDSAAEERSEAAPAEDGASQEEPQEPQEQRESSAERRGRSGTGAPRSSNGRTGSGRGRGRSAGEAAPPASTFDPTKPSDKEKAKRRPFGRAHKGRPRPAVEDEGSRPKLIRADEAPAAPTDPSDLPDLEPLDPAPEPEPRPEAPSLAEDDLFDSAFEEPPPQRSPREPRDIDSAPSKRPRAPQGDAGNGRAGDQVHGEGPGDVERRPLEEPVRTKPTGPRSLGGVELPALSGIGERLRALRLPEQLAPREKGGAVTPGVSGGGFRLGSGGRRKLPLNLPFGIGGGGGRKKGRIKKARLLIILVGLGALALVSTFFGMMMAVSSDLPDLENRTEFRASENSVVYDVTGQKLGTLTNNNNRILVESGDIAQNMKQATIAIEDKRFYEHPGVDLKGMFRAAVADVIPGGSTQGASTITQQFVKNALEAQASRTVFQKFRESALAYHLEQQWDKDKILTQYLNTIYFGEGAYGIEAAARTYFGYNHPDCGTDGYPRCASVLFPEESAMLAGIISSPSAFSPTANPEAALGRRNLVLDNEASQGYLTEGDAAIAKQKTLPSPADIERPAEDSVSPYFTSWLRQVLVDRFGPGRAFGGGLRIKTTLDLDLQQSAEDIVRNTLGGITPTSSIVVIDNKTGGIRAMVGGLDYAEHPFNLATNGHRQPGSAFKPFTLVTALEHGHSAGDTYDSRQVNLVVPNSGGKEYFEVNNYDDVYYGPSSIATCTVHSDNSCFAQLGYDIYPGNTSATVQKGLNTIVDTAHKMGVTTDITAGRKANPALILGGLSEGVTPLELAHAYSTLADDGQRVSGTLASEPGGPVPIEEIRDKNGNTINGGTNKVKKTRVISTDVAQEAKSILAGVVSSGTGKRAQVGQPQWGKTGTTDNNGDAWFCGAIEPADIAGVTACVWVGHADSTQPMETEFAGGPVDGGTFPALIWAQVINSYLSIEAEHEAAAEESGTTDSTTDTGTVAPSTSTGSAPSTDGGGDAGGDGGGGAPKPAPSAPAPAPSGGGGVGAGL